MPPTDVPDVVKALRMGWAMSEFRGRNRPDAFPDAVRTAAQWPSHALPLTEERSGPELVIEVQKVLFNLAKPIADPESPKQPEPAVTPPRTCSEYVDALSTELAKVRKSLTGSPNDPTLLASEKKWWDQLCEVLYGWDAELHDALAVSSVNQLGAYNLGRGLADSYWSLDTGAAADVATSWDRVLGQERRGLIDQYLGRLAAYFDVLTPPAISSSFSSWSSVAAVPDWRSSPDAISRLHEQLRRWYGLLVLGQNPQTYLKPLALLRNWRATRNAIRAFLPDTLMLLVGLGAATALGTLISTGYGASWFKAMLGLLGAVGLSSATITSRLKLVTKDLVSRLRTDAYSEAVAIDFTVVPDKSSRSPLRGSDERAAQRVVRLATREREVNTGGAALS